MVSVHSASISQISLEVLDEIISYFDMITLKRFARTSRRHRVVVEERVVRMTHRIIRRFVDHPQSFLNLMRVTDSIISGSGALLVLQPGTFVPNDLDVYVPVKKLDHFVTHLRIKFGYRKMRRPMDLGERRRYMDPSLSRIENILWFKRGDKVINVMSVRGANAVLPVFSFHSTVVMNYISYYGIFCAYPRLTLYLLSLINRSIAQTHTDRTIKALEKYIERGITFLPSLDNHPDLKDHICTVSRHCPQTIRSLYDTGSLFIEFSRKKIDAQSNRPRYNYRSSAVWTLECGEHCVSKQPITVGFAKDVRLEMQNKPTRRITRH